MLQQSYKNDQPTLYLVPTPIGNLQEMTPRAITILREVDLIAAEDTREFMKLRTRFDIQTPVVSYHMHNEKESAEKLLTSLTEGKNIALVSDAGYPLISDPGQTLVFEVVKAGYNVVPLSGSSAFLNALVASGLVVQPFAFLGFLEAKENKLRKQLEEYKELPMTTIYYISVHKLEKTLQMVYDVLGNRDICLARELTKQHETFIRGSLQEVMATHDTLKGEFVLVIAASAEEKLDMESLRLEVEAQIQAGASVSRAIAQVAKHYKVSKSKLYAYYHQDDKESSHENI